ncbi:hypothetical protein BDV95DRAFT_22667 [Massariosphaeria phaeospora]|uniref:Rhodopsin domain-containing protein n=1 Tax=Massariosphaeria phaeospora TaxID=100035 RepID=A0A7C8III0_9PLEO|nr:hypothetical protein BDV95DRAFT_22667 [Massariosphaeria phaeospora]
MGLTLPPGTDLFEIPYQQAPSGVKSDFEKPSDLLTLFRVIIPIMIFVTTVFLVLRIRARFGREERWKIDDWFTVATWMSATSLGLLNVVCVQKLGRSTWDISLGFLLSAWPQRVLVCMGFLVIFSMLLGKLCLLTLYYRIFGHIDSVRRQLYLTGALCFPLLAVCIIQPVLASPPHGKPWGTPNPHNTEGSIVAMGTGVVNILVDLLILYIPIPPIVKLNLSRKKRAGVLAIFLTGSIAIIADVVVMYYRVRLFQQLDSLRDGMIVGLCSFIEACISIVCSSMPCAAKIWKVDIVSSSFYLSLRSRLGLTDDSYTGSAEGPQSQEQPREPPKKKKRGLYSIGTFPTTNISTTRLSKADGFIELDSIGERISERRSSQSSFPDHREHRTAYNRESSGTSERPPLTVNDPSNYLSS